MEIFIIVIIYCVRWDCNFGGIFQRKQNNYWEKFEGNLNMSNYSNKILKFWFYFCQKWIFENKLKGEEFYQPGRISFTDENNTHRMCHTNYDTRPNKAMQNIRAKLLLGSDDFVLSSEIPIRKGLSSPIAHLSTALPFSASPGAIICM